MTILKTTINKEQNRKRTDLKLGILQRFVMQYFLFPILSSKREQFFKIHEKSNKLSENNGS